MRLNATLSPWLLATPMRLRPLMNEQDFRLAARIGLVELALAGCGPVADHKYHSYPDLPNARPAIPFNSPTLPRNSCTSLRASSS